MICLYYLFFNTFTKIHAWPIRQEKPRQSNQNGHHQIHQDPRLENLLLISCRPKDTEILITNVFIFVHVPKYIYFMNFKK